MSLTRLGFLSRNGFNLSQRFAVRTIKRNESTKPLKLQEEIDLDKPIEYSKTEAAQWLARHTRSPEENKPACQSLVLSGSLFVFFIYFFVLREENDVDTYLDRPLDQILADIQAERK